MSVITVTMGANITLTIDGQAVGSVVSPSRVTNGTGVAFPPIYPRWDIEVERPKLRFSIYEGADPRNRRERRARIAKLRRRLNDR